MDINNGNLLILLRKGMGNLCRADLFILLQLARGLPVRVCLRANLRVRAMDWNLQLISEVCMPTHLHLM